MLSPDPAFLCCSSSPPLRASSTLHHHQHQHNTAQHKKEKHDLGWELKGRLEKTVGGGGHRRKVGVMKEGEDGGGSRRGCVLRTMRQSLDARLPLYDGSQGCGERGMSLRHLCARRLSHTLPSLRPSVPPSSKGHMPQVQSFGKYVGHWSHVRQLTHLCYSQVRREEGREGGRKG